MTVLKDYARRSVAGKFHVRGGSAVFGTAMLVNLYESVQSDQLRTDKNFYVGLGFSAAGTVTATGGVTTKQATGAAGVATLVNNGDIQVQVCGGSARLIFRCAGTTYYIDKIG